MKNVCILSGSPRKNGNTATLARLLQEALNPANITSECLFLYDYTIRPCLDCRACKKGAYECTLRDDMTELYAKIEAADVLVIGTPIYWFGPSAQTKLLLDRFRPFFVNQKLAGKSMALLLPAGTGAVDCDLTIEMFRRVCEALKMNFMGSVTAEAYDIGDAEKNSDAIMAVAKLAEEMNIQ